MWATLAGLATATGVSYGRYRMIENVCLALMAFFIVFTMRCVGLLQSTEYAISMDQIQSGLANALLLLLVVYAAWTFRYRRLPKEFPPSRLYDAVLWVSFIAISAVGVLACWRPSRP